MTSTTKAETEIVRLERDLKEIQVSADARWNSDMRAVALWQNATGKRQPWPDHADLVAWLLEENEKLRTQLTDFCR